MLVGVGITFSSIALIFNALAKGYDFFTYYFTPVMTPMMFLSGVFFPLEQLPGWCARSPPGCRCPTRWRWCARCFMDQWPPDWWLRTRWCWWPIAGGRLLGRLLGLTRKRFRA